MSIQRQRVDAAATPGFDDVVRHLAELVEKSANPNDWHACAIRFKRVQNDVWIDEVSLRLDPHSGA